MDTKAITAAQILVLLGESPEDWAAERFASELWKGYDLELLVTPKTDIASTKARSPEILIVGPHVPVPRRAGTLFRRRHPSAQVLFLVPEPDLSRFRASLPFTPEIAGASAIAADTAPTELHSAVRELLDANRRERQLSGLYSRVNAMVAGKGKGSSAEDDRRRQLVVAERYLSAILTHAPEALFAADVEGRLVQLNRAAKRLFKTEPLHVGRPVAELFAPESQSRVAALVGRAVVGDVVESEEARINCVSGSTRTVELSVAPVLGPAGAVAGLSFSARDVTERLKAEQTLRELASRLEERVTERTQELAEANRALIAEMQQRQNAEGQIRQMQKMEAVGQLTGGIAHDFNNMLAVVIGGLNLVQRRLAKGDTDVGTYITGAMEGADRAAALTQRLLAFSRQQPLSPQAVNANQMVSDMSDLLRRTLGEMIEMETVLAGGLWRTHADASQLENAIVNLAVNARDAMPDGGHLTVETANCHLDDAYGAEHGVPAGQYVMVAVTDTGSGMPPEVVAKAFDPFFTTKGVGKGTGLGLSQVFGFVKQSGGHVKIYSEPGHGTTIKIYLPRFYGRAEASKSPVAQSLPRGSSSEVILLVEDDERVRELVEQMLRDLGYGVVAASGGTEGLRALDEHPEVSLLFTDVVMPGMNGRQLADEARRRRPDLKVLFTTGYTKNAVVHNGVLDPGVNLLQKPATLEQMAAKIRSVLDE
ncbi:ATP-binding protein [Aurantimonas sp. A2-1-M11]|uniref:ATP-binding protein n=1 Tax=Aurantimonas sp. A2-1-M11 TaxID=3113712 RepID=UPI002F955867